MTEVQRELQKEKKKRETRLAIMISIIVSIFVVCNSFESLLFILQSQDLLAGDIVQDYLRPLADFLMVINSGVNVIIYCTFNSMFREKFTELYFRPCQKAICWQGLTAGNKFFVSMTSGVQKETIELTTIVSQEKQQETSL